MINQNTNTGLLSQIKRMLYFLLANDLIGNQDVVHTCGDKDGCLTDLLTADTHCTSVDLTQCNLWTLMAFSMGTQAYTGDRYAILQQLYIALKCIQIQNQGWCINLIDMIANASCFPRGHGAFTFN